MDVGQNGSLRCILGALDPDLALGQSPRIPALNADKHELARDFHQDRLVSFGRQGLDVDSEVGNVGAVGRVQVVPLHDVVLSTTHSHVFEWD